MCLGGTFKPACAPPRPWPTFQYTVPTTLAVMAAAVICVVAGISTPPSVVWVLGQRGRRSGAGGAVCGVVRRWLVVLGRVCSVHVDAVGVR